MTHDERYRQRGLIIPIEIGPVHTDYDVLSNSDDGFDETTAHISQIDFVVRHEPVHLLDPVLRAAGTAGLGDGATDGVYGHLGCVDDAKRNQGNAEDLLVVKQVAEDRSRYPTDDSFIETACPMPLGVAPCHFACGLPDSSPMRLMFSGVVLLGLSGDHFGAPFLVLGSATFQHPKNGAYFLTTADYPSSFLITGDRVRSSEILEGISQGVRLLRPIVDLVAQRFSN